VRAVRLAVAIVVAGVASCTAFETNLQDTSVNFKETAKENFESAESAVSDEKYNEAVKFFDYVKNKFPYSKYAVLADLRIADTQFLREKWLEAADAYRLFVRFHPRHEGVGYAMYRTALAHHNAIEKAWAVFAIIDPVQRDQTAARDTVRACDDYLARFPTTAEAPKVKEMRIAARSRLAEVDVFVAGFDADRDHHQGAVWRYLRVADEFGDTPQASSSLFRAAELTRDHLDAKDAGALFARVVKDYPKSAEAAVVLSRGLASMTEITKAAGSP
jgi:outer membrane protein assembly factor BamD